MGKPKLAAKPLVVEPIKDKSVEGLLAQNKASATKIFKLEQKLVSCAEEIKHLRACLRAFHDGAALARGPVVQQLKEEARQLRLEVTNLKLEALRFQKERDGFKAERDNALVQQKALFERAAEEPPAP